MFVLLLVIGVLVVVGAILIGAYNGLIRRRNRIENAWSQIDVQFKRRLDLSPNLVETVKGYAAHEGETLEDVISARNAAIQAPDTPDGQAAVSNKPEGALGKLFALSESYPDLKANQNFMQLREELTTTEGRVTYSRQIYNDSVFDCNNKLEEFSTVLLANAMKCERSEYFEAEEAARTSPSIGF